MSYAQIPRSFRLPILGSVPYFLASWGPAKFHEYVDSLHKRLGPIFVENMGGKELLFISDPIANLRAYRSEGKYPEHFIPEAWEIYLKETGKERGIFFMDGPEWYKNRRILNKHLLKNENSESYGKILSPIIDDVIKVWETNHPGKKLEYFLYNWNIECLGALFFGKRLHFLDRFLEGKTGDGKQTEKDDFVKAVHDIFLTSVPLSTCPPLIAKKLGLKVWKNFYQATTKGLELGEKLVREAMEEHKSEIGKETLLKNLIDESMDEDTIVKIIVDLFMAAGDTTSQAAMWAIYLLGRHEKIAQIAREEVRDVIGDANLIEGHHLDRLHYLKAVLKEVHRLYPVAPFLTRRIKEDALLKGFQVPKGTLIATSLYTMGRSEEIFSRPNEFLPHRWLRTPEMNCQKTEKREARMALVPFGIGARSCVGRRISETELLILLARLLQRTEWHVEERVQMVLRMVSVPEKPFDVRVRKLVPS